jgi:hypothetical protein
MFSGFRRKGSQPTDPSPKKAAPRGLEVIEDDPDTAWGLWDNALAEQESRFGVLDAEGGPDPNSVTTKADPLAPVEDVYVATEPMGLEEKSSDQRKTEALAVVEMHHHRIANTIRTLWGYKECSIYISKLIMNGGDGMGQARIGFNQDAAQAMMVLAELHDAQFGVDDSAAGLGFGDHTVRSGLDGAR